MLNRLNNVESFSFLFSIYNMAKIKLKKRKDMIPGGLADKKQPTDFDQEALKKGLKVELEHTSDSDIALEIAMDHLTEDPLYYDKLAKMEKGGIKEVRLKIKKNLLKEQNNMAVGSVEAAPTAPPDFSGTPDSEGDMARSQMLKVNEYSAELMDMITPEMQLPAWVQAKLTKVADYMGAVKHFLEGEMKLGEELTGDQEKLDVAEPKGELTAADFAALRKKKDLSEQLEETYIFEGSCEDDGTIYEMELYSEECGCGALEETLEEAEYQGRKVTLNKPMRGDVKKFKVFVKDPKTGNVKKVNFGDPNMRIKKSNPKRRKSFRARHRCDNPGPKTKARYWSCRKWEE